MIYIVYIVYIRIILTYVYRYIHYIHQKHVYIYISVNMHPIFFYKHASQVSVFPNFLPDATLRSQRGQSLLTRWQRSLGSFTGASMVGKPLRVRVKKGGTNQIYKGNAWGSPVTLEKLCS